MRDENFLVLNKKTNNETVNYFEKYLDDVAEQIAKGEYKFADAENGAKSTLTSIMGRMATYSGKVIKWEDALKNYELIKNEYSRSGEGQEIDKYISRANAKLNK